MVWVHGWIRYLIGNGLLMSTIRPTFLLAKDRQFGLIIVFSRLMLVAFWNGRPFLMIGVLRRETGLKRNIVVLMLIRPPHNITITIVWMSTADWNERRKMWLIFTPQIDDNISEFRRREILKTLLVHIESLRNLTLSLEVFYHFKSGFMKYFHTTK